MVPPQRTATDDRGTTSTNHKVFCALAFFCGLSVWRQMFFLHRQPTVAMIFEEQLVHQTTLTVLPTITINDNKNNNNHYDALLSDDNNTVSTTTMYPKQEEEEEEEDEEKEEEESYKWKYPVSTVRNESSSTRVIALLSMGPSAAKSVLVERILVSIRRRHVGNFSGLVWLLTDAPSERYAALEQRDPNFVVMHPRLEDWNWETTQDMPYKRFKTYFLEYLNRDERLSNVELVYYLDIDVVIGRPLQPWFDHVETTYLDTPSDASSQLVLFKGNYAKFPFQGGQFILRRNYSEPCLTRWRHHIDSNVEAPKDQDALIKVHQESKRGSGICHLTVMPQKPYLRFLREQTMERIHESKNYTTLMHIKNTQNSYFMPKKTLQTEFFRGLLQLTPEETSAIAAKLRIRPNSTWSAEIVATSTDGGAGDGAEDDAP